MFLCIRLAITCATLLAAGHSEALKSSTQSDWPLIRVKFHGKEIGELKQTGRQRKRERHLKM